MELIFQLSCSRSFLNEFPSNLHLLTCTSLKTPRVMEDKVASRVGNLVLNIMHAPLYINEWKYICFTIQLTSIEGVKCVDEDVGEGFKCVSESTDFLLKSCFMDSLNRCFTLGLGVGLASALSSTPCSSNMMGLVPCATPQTFSRMVVFPALALPMTRMRKWGQRYWSLSIAMDSASTSIAKCHIWQGWYSALTHLMQYWEFLPLLILCEHDIDGLSRYVVAAGMAREGWWRNRRWFGGAQGKGYCAELRDETKMVCRILSQHAEGNGDG